MVLINSIIYFYSIFCFIENVISTIDNEIEINSYGLSDIDGLNTGWTSGIQQDWPTLKVYKVTNLNSSGKGSLINALLAKEPRLIVFEVSGNIDFKGRSIKIECPYLRILGQTSPEVGITIINGGLRIATHDVIVQHLHIRPGDTLNGNSIDGITTMGGAYDIIVDHCSFSWAIDENLSASGPRFQGNTVDEWRNNTSHRITFSNNIIAEGLANSKHSDSVSHSMGMLIHDNVTDVLIIGNLFYSNDRRNPIFKGGASGAIVNNFIYNPGKMAMAYRLSEKEWANRKIQKGRISIVGNYMEKGINSKDIPLFEAIYGECELFFKDNLAIERNGKPIELYRGDTSNLVSNYSIWNQNITPIPIIDVKNYVLNNSGANPKNRDYIDQRIIKNIISKKGVIIDSETFVGGFRQTDSVFRKFNPEILDSLNLKYLN
ncbi:hypothetical protein [Algoriphagus zhangzhouensis]|uniref:Pectate lyase n=1 Tax=Algoriphagus zhangzhouensis TaxID=1073327 RepID=A0A1M7Z3E1_9BACT|nr:hypothetical protein [Algoriphagus zhangzhouensis]TDY48364.1 pectate lyase [Algoriphagus zhangzhouensis]SHO59411.1 Pectate lyase [Algoriphagus zhangzhouensis]